MRILELFGGYGSQALALENLGIDFTSDLCEIDKYAIQAYNQLHGETHNWGDICKIDETQLPYYDLITYSSPCQDFSVAGKQAGGDKGSGTRSSLLWECERIIRAVKPKYLLMENVKNLVGEKHMHNFIAWLRTLESMGYKNWWQVLNAKDYGVPQNRERVFVVSILGGGQYQFPEPIPLTKRLKDVLEQNVDEKYYLSEKICERFQYKKVGRDIVGSTLGKECTRKGQRDLVYGTDNKIGALSSTDYKQPKQILEPFACASRGRNPDNPSDRTIDNTIAEPLAYDEQNGYIRKDGCVGTLTTDGSSPKHNNRVVEPKVETHIIPQTVYVRKYDVDIKRLQEILRFQKGTLGYTNKQISEKLNKPITNVEHWFRTDDGFSIPEKDVWFSLKELLNIGTDEFDDSITTFEEKDNVFEKANRCYGVGGVSPTLTATSSDEKIIEPKVINPLAGKSDFGWHFEQEVYDEKGIARAVKAGGGSGNIPKVMQVGNIVHTGNFENPQRGRIYSSNGCSPALSTMQGGGLEPKIVDDIYPSREPRVYENTCPTLKTHHAGDLKVMDYRIRKLTPRECWRLMGVKDEQFDKLHDISNSQLYKMAGNSIVVDVLMGIFKNLFMPTKQKGQLELF